MLTTRINELTEHLRAHQKDHHSRRGLLKLVGRRRRLLDYFQKRNLEGYRALIKELGLGASLVIGGWSERAPGRTLTQPPPSTIEWRNDDYHD